MMNYDKMKSTLDSLSDDIMYSIVADGFRVQIQDFDGFDDDWNEIMREYNNANAIDEFIDMLESDCISQDGDFNYVYHFDGFDVELSYASDEI
jgi:hypothetical protein